jgi:uncharacterized protein YndB with AHSA1/START domain
MYRKINIFLYIAKVLLNYTIQMSKKKITPKKVKKNIKPVKSKPANKAKIVKQVKKSVPKNTTKSANVVKKVAGSAKLLKKSVLNLVPKKVIKVLTKKAIKPIIAKKTIKPLVVKKPVAKVEIVKSKGPKKPLKEEIVVKLAVKKEEKVKIIPEKGKKARGKGGRKPKRKDGDDDEPEIVHDELIEQLILSTKKKKQGHKVPKILKTFVNPMTSLTVAPSETNGKKGNSIPKKEPKGKFELEYVIRTSAGILYEFITSPSGLSEWFADDVNIRDGVFTFFWDGSEQKAKLLGFKEEKYIRLSWLDKPEGTYFEFRIDKDELTGDISLIIIDFADEASDLQTSKLLWDSQVNKLLGVLGSN